MGLHKKQERQLKTYLSGGRWPHTALHTDSGDVDTGFFIYFNSVVYCHLSLTAMLTECMQDSTSQQTWIMDRAAALTL